MLQYDSKLYVQVLLSSYTLQAPEMLQYVSQLYVQVLLSSLRYKLLKCCNMILNCMFRSS